MQKKIVIDNIKIKQDSIFNTIELYKALFSWFANYGYSFYEQEYTEVDVARGKNVRFLWQGEKEMDAYIKWGIELQALILGLENVEIERNGLKLKTNKCSIEIRITAYLIKDPEDKWSKAGVAVFRKLYDKIIARQRYSRMEDELVRETNKLVDEIKAFLNLYQL